MNAYCYVVTEEKLQPQKDKIFNGLKVALKHLVFDFDEPIKDKETDSQPNRDS